MREERREKLERKTHALLDGLAALKRRIRDIAESDLGSTRKRRMTRPLLFARSVLAHRAEQLLARAERLEARHAS